jgi:hypothetical protein
MLKVSVALPVVFVAGLIFVGGGLDALGAPNPTRRRRGRRRRKVPSSNHRQAFCHTSGRIQCVVWRHIQ